MGGVSEVVFFVVLSLIAVLLLAVLTTYQILSLTVGSPGYDFDGFLLRLLPILALLVVSAYRVVANVFRMGTSEERREALVQKATQLKVVSDTFTPHTEFPNIPRGMNITNSPGIHLKYRLPIIQLSAWRFFTLSLLCLILTAIASALVVTAWSQYQMSIYPWASWVMAIVFSAVAFIAVYAFLWEVMTYSGLGPTCLEISEHPLFPGKTYEIFLSQAGRMTLKQLELKLSCFEEVTYQQGTDIRTESNEVRVVPIATRNDVSIEPDLPYVTSASFVLPDDAMHSFQSSHNHISWVIIVTGDVENWPRFDRRFPVVVYPPNSELN